jgi:hypothetical protein
VFQRDKRSNLCGPSPIQGEGVTPEYSADFISQSATTTRSLRCCEHRSLEPARLRMRLNLHCSDPDAAMATLSECSLTLAPYRHQPEPRAVEILTP